MFKTEVNPIEDAEVGVLSYVNTEEIILR